MFAFGSVPSRRLGNSIGVNLIPHKTCSYSCIYCQLGLTTDHTGDRKHFFPKDEVMNDIRTVVLSEKNEANVITFAGEGEPTLNADLGYYLEKCSQEFGLVTAILTNGSLLYDKEVREEVSKADIVNITLCSHSQAMYEKIHRPSSSLQYEQVKRGISDFAHEYKGRLWIEVMILNNINTSTYDMIKIREQITALNPEKVFVMVPHRPPAVSSVTIPGPEKIIEAIRLFDAENITEIEQGNFGLSEYISAKEAIMGISYRHPLRIEQAKEIEKYFQETCLVDLIEKNLIKIIHFNSQDYILPGVFVRN